MSIYLRRKWRCSSGAPAFLGGRQEHPAPTSSAAHDPSSLINADAHRSTSELATGHSPESSLRALSRRAQLETMSAARFTGRRVLFLHSRCKADRSAWLIRLNQSLLASIYAYLQLFYYSGGILHSPRNVKPNLQVLASFLAYKMAVIARRLTRSVSCSPHS